MSVQARVVVLVARVGPEVRVVWLALSEVVIDDRSEKWQHCHHDGKAHRPHSDKHAIHSKKSIALDGIFVTATIPLDRRGGFSCSAVFGDLEDFRDLFRSPRNFAPDMQFQRDRSIAADVFDN